VQIAGKQKHPEVEKTAYSWLIARDKTLQSLDVSLGWTLFRRVRENDRHKGVRDVVHDGYLD
jgi:hypothetical protein